MTCPRSRSWPAVKLGLAPGNACFLIPLPPGTGWEGEQAGEDRKGWSTGILLVSSSWGGQLEAWHRGCRSLVSLKVRVLPARSRDHQGSASSATSSILLSGVVFLDW